MIATTRYYARHTVHIAITSPVNEQVDPAEVALCGAIVIGYPDTAFDSNCDACILALEALEAAEVEALATLRTSKPAVQTWFGRRARYTVIRKGRSTTSERVTITEWLDDARPDNGGHKAGTVVVRHITGDGRFIDTGYREFATEVMAGTDAVERATRWAHDALLGRQGRDHALRTLGAHLRPRGVWVASDCTPATGC